MSVMPQLLIINEMTVYSVTAKKTLKGVGPRLLPPAADGADHAQAGVGVGVRHSFVGARHSFRRGIRLFPLRAKLGPQKSLGAPDGSWHPAVSGHCLAAAGWAAADGEGLELWGPRLFGARETGRDDGCRSRCLA